MEDMLYHSVPKLELHRHAEGSVRTETYIDILRSRGLGGLLPVKLWDREAVERLISIGPDDKRGFHLGLSHFAWLRHAFADKEAIARILAEAIEDAAAEGAVYQELRLSAGPLLAKGIPGQDILAAVEEGIRLGERSSGIKAAVILGINREMDLGYAAQVLELAINGAGNGVCGIDLLSDEAYPPEQFAGIYQRALDAGVHRTVHAGEYGSARNIQTAVRLLHAERIGHGLKLYDGLCPDLPAEIRDRGVHIECCPTSNVIFGVLEQLYAHPLPRMIGDGISVSINTDDPRVIHWGLCREYEEMHRVFQLSPQRIAALMLAAVDSIFRDDCKPYLRGCISGWLEKGKMNYENC